VPAADGRTRAIDFDALELMNGASFGKFLRVRDDWYALLRQGYVRTATANSDTHGPDEPAGYPRNYVRPGGPPGEWDLGRFDAAIRAGRSFGTNGPLIADFRANGARSGERAGAEGGAVVVSFAVAAAPWVPVDEVRLLVNGEVVRRYASADLSGEDVLRLRRNEELALERDAFITLEAGVPLDTDRKRWAETSGGIYASTIAPGFLPIAFANPIFVDVDGNGRFDPPGLPPAPPLVARAWLVSAAVVALSSAAWLWRRRRG
jgi:hypothetical protein